MRKIIGYVKFCQKKGKCIMTIKTRIIMRKITILYTIKTIEARCFRRENYKMVIIIKVTIKARIFSARKLQDGTFIVKRTINARFLMQNITMWYKIETTIKARISSARKLQDGTENDDKSESFLGVKNVELLI